MSELIQTTFAAVIHPLWPASSEAAAHTPGISAWVWIVGGCALALVIGGIVSWLAWRDRRRHAPVERAFRAMARRLRLGRVRAELVRVMAEDRDMPPVALLISQRAFDHAAASSTRGLDAQSLDALRRHIFSEH